MKGNRGRRSGVDIPGNALPHLFERFYCAPNAASFANGTGLGLFIVHELIARHGGTINVASVEGQGSTFTLTIPIDSPEG